MAHGDRIIHIGRDASGNVMIAGDGNQGSITLTRTELPPAAGVDIAAELERIRAILVAAGGEHAGKIGRALDDAAEEAAKPEPDKHEVGTALNRALDYAKQVTGLTAELEKLAPHVRNAVGWLGDNWHRLLPLVGLVV
jgi:hypothetical protein